MSSQLLDRGLDSLDGMYVMCLNDPNSKCTSQMEYRDACAESVVLDRFWVFFILREFQVLAKCVMCCILFAYYYRNGLKSALYQLYKP